MKNKIDPKEWAKDFDSFMNAEGVNPPTEISQKILTFVHQELNPSIWNILAKLGAIHLVVGTLSLFICSQFGMGSGQMLFMSFGVIGCTALCGSLFLGLTTFVAGFTFSPEELRKVRKTGYSPILLLGVVSLILFILFGAEIAMNLALIWLVGALVAGVLATEFSIGMRKIILK